MIELLLQAERALSVGLVDQAESLYRQVLEADPRNSIAVVGLARVALERGDDAEAYVRAEQALIIDPENVAASRLVDRLAEVFLHRGWPLPDASLVVEPELAVGRAPAPTAARASLRAAATEPGPTAAPELGTEPRPGPEPERGTKPRPGPEPEHASEPERGTAPGRGTKPEPEPESGGNGAPPLATTAPAGPVAGAMPSGPPDPAAGPEAIRGPEPAAGPSATSPRRSLIDRLLGRNRT
jgi:hypothetical protein